MFYVNYFIFKLKNTANGQISKLIAK